MTSKIVVFLFLYFSMTLAAPRPQKEMREAFRLLSQGKNMVYNKKYAQALSPLLKARKVFSHFESQINLILVYFYLGRAYEGLHQQDKADSAFSHSIFLYENLNQKEALPLVLQQTYAQSLYYRARIALNRNLGMAMQWARKSLNVFRKIRDQQGITASTKLLGIINRKIGQRDKAKPGFVDYQRLEQARDLQDTLEVLQNVGENLIATGQLDSALILFQRINNLASQRAYLPAQIMALKYLGYLYFQLGNFRRSRDIFQKLLPRTSFSDWYPHYGLARCYLAYGDTSQALQHLTLTLQIIEDLRSSLPLPEQRTSFIADKMDAYNLIVDLSLTRGDYYPALQYAERAKARSFAEAVLASQIESEPALDSLLHSTNRQFSSLKDVQRILDDQTIILYFFVTNTLHVWVISNHRFRYLSFNKKLMPELMELRDRILSHFPERPLTESLKKLYDQTFGILDPLVRQYRRIILIPHGLLHYFPFAALYDGQHYLIDRFELVYLPNLSLLPLMAAHNWRPPEKILVMINPQADLPFISREAEWIVELFPQSTILETSRVLKEGLIGTLEASDAEVFHFAMHASLNSVDPLRSYLYIGPGVQFSLDDILHLRLSASMAVLSACDTGVGPVQTGDNLKSLSRAFLQAGIPVVLASLWPVRDRSTALLMKYFYYQLKSGKRPSAALKEAIKNIRKQNSQFAHPYFWGAFVQLGGYLK